MGKHGQTICKDCGVSERAIYNSQKSPYCSSCKNIRLSKWRSGKTLQIKIAKAITLLRENGITSI